MGRSESGEVKKRNSRKESGRVLPGFGGFSNVGCNEILMFCYKIFQKMVRVNTVVFF